MRLFGHPVHPMLVAFPIALLGLTPVWDAMAWAGVMAEGKTVGYFFELAELITAGLAIIAGFADFMNIPQSKAATVKVALTHGGLALAMISIFGVAFAFRGGRAAAPSTVIVVLEAIGALCLAVTGWFGGHLVFRHGVGVDSSPTPAGAKAQQG